MMKFQSRFKHISVICLTLSGCKTLDRLSNIDEIPPLTRIQNPESASDYQPVTMPMPTPQIPVKRVNSLWQTGARAFFRDQRASREGDILTVLVTIDDKADIQNNTGTSRQTSEQLGIPNVMGLEQPLSYILPNAMNPKSFISTNSNPQFSGNATVSRKEQINLRLAASITQVLPNGNLFINGRQEFRVNNDVRELVVSGIIRPEDITSSNTISYDKIEQARISYGGRGLLSDQQKPRWGAQVLDAILPM